MPGNECLVVFVKCPQKGLVKSRLAEESNSEIAITLYRHFVLDLLDTFDLESYRLKIYFTPSGALKSVSAWLGEKYEYLPQRGKDLGERMANAFSEMFCEGFSKVVLIGSDLPDLTRAIIDAAYAFDGYDAVIGPTVDGGYYLIGFTCDTFAPEIFDGIPWGTNRVFGDTMKIFKSKKYRVNVLPIQRDIDRLEDLRAFFERNRNSRFSDSGTMACIRDNFEVLFGKANGFLR